MDLSFAFFWKQVLGSPALMITVFLTLCVIFVNGWTDAPNAIATCVSTRFNGMTMVDVTKGVKVGGATVFFIDIDRMQKF